MIIWAAAIIGYLARGMGGYARRIVGWRVSLSAHAGFVLDALEQALHDRKPASGGGLYPSGERPGGSCLIECGEV